MAILYREHFSREPARFQLDLTTRDDKMLDINLLRAEKGGNPDLVRESQRRRYAKDANMVDEVIAVDVEWRQAQFQVKVVTETFD